MSNLFYQSNCNYWPSLLCEFHVCMGPSRILCYFDEPRKDFMNEENAIILLTEIYSLEKLDL